MAKKLTETQRKVLTTVINHVIKNHSYHSIRELGKELEIKSLRGVTVHLDALERKMYLVRIPNKPRQMRVLKDSLGNRIKLVTEVVFIDG